MMVDHIKAKSPDVELIVGLESRGFLFAPLIALRLNCGFAPVRKKGKLPGEKERVEYSLEYGTVKARDTHLYSSRDNIHTIRNEQCVILKV